MSHEWAERHGLIPAMIHGKKTFTEEEWREVAASENVGEWLASSKERATTRVAPTSEKGGYKL
ncbi:MAG: hypothetical protein HY266_08200 [Deltaproteobacteria bacterium]|nr:hypothetical protein [Deltaproteobacteria bacterium]